LSLKIGDYYEVDPLLFSINRGSAALALALATAALNL